MKKFLPSIVLLLLALALLAWVWMFNHLLENERSMAETREKEWINTYLISVGEKFEKETSQQLPAALTAFKQITDGTRQPNSPPYLNAYFSGVWKEVNSPPASKHQSPEVAQNLIKHAKDIDAEGFLTKIDTEEWKFGWVEDGRDIAATTALRLLETTEDKTQSTRLAQLLWRCVSQYNQPPLRPGFRLFIIEELINNDLLNNEQHAIAYQIKVWETFQAIHGDPKALPVSMQGKVIQYDKDTKVFFLQSSITKILDKLSHGPKIKLLDFKPNNPELHSHRVQIGQSSHWLCLADQTASLAPEYRNTSRVIMWMSSASVALLVIGGGLAVWSARNDLRLARLRTDLAASVAHELRTPLAGQRLVLETLLSNRETPQANSQEYLEMAFRENQRLSQLAEEFLTFSRLERGILSLEPTPLKPYEIIQSASELLQPKWDDPNCSFTMDVPEDLPLIRGDQQGLITVLRNLLENAWKYTGDNKQISISAREGQQGVWIEVKDNGIGLSQKDQARIFKQFYRVDHKLSQERSGIGLGLAIVKRITETLHGKLHVDSQIGQGSTFGIWLPKYK